jgi:hypothetical protein
MISRRSVRTHCLAAFALVVIVGVAGLQGTASAAPASPTLSNQASGGWWAGTYLYDTGNLNGGVNPTGYITYVLYGPDDATCSRRPAWVTFTHVFGNGYYSSASYLTSAAGTYRWISWYSGDANNYPSVISACGAPSATAAVGKRNVTLSGKASPASSLGTLTNTATLGQGVGPTGPTGTITFTLFGPGNLTCSGPPIFTSVKPVTTNGLYLSDAYRPGFRGKYSWKLAYSGDANNVAQYTTCSDPANQVTL